jgi:hypothetical protein
VALKELAILLSARGAAKTAADVTRVSKSVSTLDRAAGRGGVGLRKLGAGFAALGLGALALRTVKSGIDSLVEREGVVATTAAAIKSTGQAAKFSAPEIRAWSEAIETATGAAVDDKAIQAGANNLLRFGTISHNIFQRALADATDLGAGMKTGPEAASKLLGKALSDPAKAMTALRKAGIVLTKAEEDRVKQLVKGNKVQEAQVVLLAAVEKRYKGAAAASVGPYQRSLNILKDVAEDAKMALAEGLLPVITKVADKLSKKLADPKVLDEIRGFGKDLAAGFDKALGFAEKIPWSTIGDSMKIAGQGAKAAFGIFTSMPPWVQTAVLTGWGLNKLSGGAVTGFIGELGKGLIKGVLGMNAGVVNIKAGVVNGGGKAGVVNGGGSSKIVQAVSVLSIAADALAVFEVWKDQNQQSTDKAIEIQQTQLEWLKTQPKREDLVTGLNGIKQGIHDIESNPLNMLVQGDALNKLRAMQADQEAALAKLDAINTSIKSLPSSFGSAKDQGRGTGPDGRPTNSYVDKGGGKGGGRAAGGPVWPGGSYTVGENGPERLTMGRGGGYVTPLGGRGGGRPPQVIIPVHVTVTHSARDSHRANKRYRRVGNGSVVTVG